MIGDKSVGKTSIVKRYIDNFFTVMTESTIGTQFCQKTVSVKHPLTTEPTDVRLQIWDTAGEEKFRSVTPMYYKNASAVMIVYDITDEESF